MKGVHVLISAALLILITFSAILLVFNALNPVIERNKEQMIYKEAQNNLIELNKAITDVVYEGEGSARSINLGITGGEYHFNPADDSLNFYMETRQQILAEGVSKIENSINITASVRKIDMRIRYQNVDIANEMRFGKGNRRIQVRNIGFVSGKSVINVLEV